MKELFALHYKLEVNETQSKGGPAISNLFVTFLLYDF